VNWTKAELPAQVISSKDHVVFIANEWVLKKQLKYYKQLQLVIVWYITFHACYSDTIGALSGRWWLIAKYDSVMLQDIPSLQMLWKRLTSLWHAAADTRQQALSDVHWEPPPSSWHGPAALWCASAQAHLQKEKYGTAGVPVSYLG